MAQKEIKRLLLVGDTFIGKTCLTSVLANQEYDGVMNGGTMGMDFKIVYVDHPTKAGQQLQLQM